MAKKKSGSASAKAQKKAKASQKTEKKEKKKSTKSKRVDEEEDDDDDLEGILSKLQREWEEAHKVTEELVQPPTRRANATLTACPNGSHIWCIGGEFYSEDGRAHFYNDVFRYSPDKDEWRKFICPTCPGPRSAHAVATTQAGGGKLFLFGGEFSSLHQNTFFHYRDFWVFDVATHQWDQIDTKIRPSARSGHRMVTWKHYIFLYGGFYDPGIRTKYLDDLWVFDTQEYKWKQIEFKPNESKPSARSGFSFLSTPDGLVLHGGYCKEYIKGQRPVGIMLEDTWFLKITQASSADPSQNTSKSKSTSKANVISETLQLKWEKRKRPSTAYAPCARSGCTMTLYSSMKGGGGGVMFGGVTDKDTGEEGMESVFWNDLNAYQWSGKGRWVSLGLRKKKDKGGKGAAKKRKKVAPKKTEEEDEGEGEGQESGNEENEHDGDDVVAEVNIDSDTHAIKSPSTPSAAPEKNAAGLDLEVDPILSTPSPRYNAMLAVLKNTLFIFGGIFEKGSHEYTMDDFYSLNLDKMDRFHCIKQSEIVIRDEESSSSDEDDDEEDPEEESEDGEDSEEAGDEGSVVTEDDEAMDKPKVEVSADDTTSPTEVDIRAQATAFMGVSKDTARSPEDVISTPMPGETLAMFYSRSREYWTNKALASGASDNRGKDLRRDGFTLAQEKYEEYAPILKEIEKILAQAGLDEEEMRQGAASGGKGGAGESRHRR